MDWSPQTNYHKAHYEALDTPNLNTGRDLEPKIYNSKLKWIEHGLDQLL